MFYFIFTMIVVCLLFFIRRDRRVADKYLIAALACFVADVFALILYVSRDVFYYHILKQYFSFPQFFWDIAMYTGIPRMFLIRVINASSLLFVLFSLAFSAQYLQSRARSMRRFFTIGGIIAALLYLSTDPSVYKEVYYLLCGSLCTPGEIHSLRAVYGQILHIFLLFILVFAALRVIRSTIFVSRLSWIRQYCYLECISFLSLLTAYGLVFWFAPSPLIDVSKLARIVSYRQIPLTQKNLLIYKIFPYYITFSALAVLFIVLRYVKMQNQVSQNKFEISSKIDASETTSKAFCHYMKNEILSLQAEIEMLEVREESKGDKAQALNDCDYIYQRLDEIHRSTRMGELTLKPCDPGAVMDNILLHMKSTLSECTVTTEYASSVPYIMLDETYFEQAVHNLLSNAAEAMTGKGPEENRIRIAMTPVDNRLQIEISDNGTGIPPRLIDQIFMPFVSSHSIKKHWGVGLSLTYKIIQAHGGSISVHSEEGHGSTFTIILPTLLSVGIRTSEEV